MNKAILTAFLIWAAIVLYGFWRNRKWFIAWCENWLEQMKWTWENAPKIREIKKKRKEEKNGRTNRRINRRPR